MRHFRIVLGLGILLLPVLVWAQGVTVDSAALGQAAIPAANGVSGVLPMWAEILIGLLGSSVGASLLSANVRSRSGWMKVVDALAFNILKARNDPRLQLAGKSK